MEPLMAAIKFLWGPVLTAIAAIAWLIRLEAGMLQNRRDVQELKREAKEDRKEIKADFEKLRTDIQDNTRYLEKVIMDALREHKG